MLENIGTTEVLIIVLVLVVIFGSGKIAELGKNLGMTTKELKRTKKEYEDAVSGVKEERTINDEKSDTKEV